MTFHCYWVEEHTKFYSPVGWLDLKFLKDRKLRLASLKLAANELKISRSPKGKNHLPTINFQMLSCDSSMHGSLDIHVNWPEKWVWGVLIQGDEFRYFLIGIAIDKHWQVILTRSKATIARKIWLKLHEQWKKPSLFGVYSGLYYPIMWGF